jgi:hypothetical protein
MIMPLLPAAFFAFLLTYGLLSGKMPAGRASPALKSEEPTTYWMLAGVWALALLGCVAWFTLLLLR